MESVNSENRIRRYTLSPVFAWLFSAIFFLIPFLVYVLLKLNFVQSGIISLAESVLHRGFDHDYWHGFISGAASTYIGTFLPACFMSVFLYVVWYFREKKADINKAHFEKNFLLIMFLLWCAVTVITVVKHEPWCDEIHAWQIAKYSFFEIFSEMKYEGHFVPWFYILYPFAHMGLPFRTINIISWVLNACVMGFFLLKAPFNVFVKTIVLFSLPFAYINPAISRVYVLIPLVMFLIAEYYHKSSEHPYMYSLLLVLLANTHLYMEGMVAVLALIFLLKNKKVFSKKTMCLVFLILGLGACAAAFQVVPSIFVAKGYGGLHCNLRDFYTFFTGVGIGKGYYENRLPEYTLFIILFAGLIFLFLKNKLSCLILAFSFAYMAFFCIAIYYAGVANRAILWFYLFVFCMWIVQDEKAKTKTISSCLMILVSLFLFQPKENLKDIREPYSKESKISTYISENISKETPLYTYNNNFCTCLLEYLPEHNLIDVVTLEPLKNCKLDKQLLDIKLEPLKVIRNVFDQNPEMDFFYLIDEENGEGLIENHNVPVEYTTVINIVDNPWSGMHILKIYR